MTQNLGQGQRADALNSLIKDLGTYAYTFNKSTSSGQQKISCLDKMSICIKNFMKSSGMSRDEIGETLGLTDTVIKDIYYESMLFGAKEALTKAREINMQEEINLSKKIGKLSAHLQAAADLLESAGKHMREDSESNRNKMYAYFGATPEGLRNLASDVDTGKAFELPATTDMSAALGNLPIIKIPESTL